MPRGEPTREMMSTSRNFRGESNTRNPVQKCEIQLQIFRVARSARPTPQRNHRDHARNSLGTYLAADWPFFVFTYRRSAARPSAVWSSDDGASTAPPFPVVLPSVYLMANHQGRVCLCVMRARSAPEQNSLCAGKCAKFAVLESQRAKSRGGSQRAKFPSCADPYYLPT